jgi:acetyl-CoA carboxylase beta subunit
MKKTKKEKEMRKENNEDYVAKCKKCGQVFGSFGGLVDEGDGSWSCPYCFTDVPIDSKKFDKALMEGDIPGYR